MSRFLSVCCCTCIVVMGCCQAGSAPAEDQPATAPGFSVAQKLLKALDSPTSFEFVDQPLQDAIDFLKEYHGIEIQFDLKALEEPSITPTETTVSSTFKGISLRSALNLMLSRVDESLTHVIKDEVLLITTKAAALHMVDTRIYQLPDNRLAGLVQQTLAWRHKVEFSGAPEPALAAHGNLLVVSASLPEQEVVRAFLLDLQNKTPCNPAESAKQAAAPRADAVERDRDAFPAARAPAQKSLRGGGAVVRPSSSDSDDPFGDRP